jgi:hypothetical protein
VKRREEELAFTRRQAALAAQHIERLCKAERTPHPRLFSLTWEATRPAADLPCAILRLADARHELEEAEARRPRPCAAARCGRWVAPGAGRFMAACERSGGSPHIGPRRRDVGP